MKKIIPIIIILGCFLLLGNISVAALTLKNDSIQTLNLNNKTINFEEPYLKDFKCNAGGPYSTDSDFTITFDGSHSYLLPINGNDYIWDFGDGSNGYGVRITHTYSQPGIYYATLTINTEKGDQYQDITSVYVQQNGDHLQPYGGCLYEAKKLEEVVFDASKSTSADPNLPISQYIWHLGDGTVKYGKKVTHQYEKEKIYLVTLEIRDELGNMRQDVLHADIGYDYTNIEDFFLNPDSKITNFVKILLNKVGSQIFFPWLDFKIYTEHNGFEQYVPISNENNFPLDIDVNNDGDKDIRVENIVFFNPVISQSPFNNFPWFSFETTLSNIKFLSSDILIDDDFSVCLQFSLVKLQSLLGIDEPIVRIGYQSKAGEQKPTTFSATHIFRPYLLLNLIGGGGHSQNQNTNTVQYYNSVTQTTTTQSNTQTNSQQTTPLNNKLQDNENNDLLLEGQKLNQKPIPGSSWSIIPENGIRLESANAQDFRWILSFSDVLDTTKTTFAAHLESISKTTITHRRSPEIRDVDINGADNSGLTLSVTKENQYGEATIGVKINPLESFGFGIDIGRLGNNARQIAFNIENPPQNLILFRENEDNQGGQNSLYLYFKNLPTSMVFEWLPVLEGGYIQFSKIINSEETRVGICDDLEDPDFNVYATNLPDRSSISWVISTGSPKEISFTSEIEGLTFHADLKDITYPDETLKFMATSNTDFHIQFSWDFSVGYFDLKRSSKDISFEINYENNKHIIYITGNFMGGPNEGFTIYLKDITDGILQLSNEMTLNVNIHALNTANQVEFNTDINFMTAGQTEIIWNDRLDIRATFSSSLAFNNFDIQTEGRQNWISADQILLASGGNFAFTTKEDQQGKQLLLSSTAQVAITMFDMKVGYWTGDFNLASAGGGLSIFLKPDLKFYQLENSVDIKIDEFSISYDIPGSQTYDLLLELDSFSVDNSGLTWFDFGGVVPKFYFDNDDDVDLSNLHLEIGDGLIDFTISNAHLDSNGNVYGEWDSDTLYVDANIDLNWNIDIQTINYGNWELNGNIEGSASVEAEWDSGTGFVEFQIDESGIAHNLEIIHESLTFNLGSFNFDAGTITFEWQRETTSDDGYFKVTNDGVDGSLNLCNIDYPPSSLEINLGTIDIGSGNFYLDWNRDSTTKEIHLTNTMNVDMDLIKITKSGKTVGLEGLSLNPGQLRFTWNNDDNIITLKNGINSLGPTLYYEDSERRLEVDLTNLENDYSKTMILKWYEDSGSISGLTLDTDNNNLVDWIQFTSIKYDTNGDTGKRIKLGGLKADDFTIKKSGSKIKVTGELYLVNQITYSKLVNDDWKDLIIKWNLNLDGNGYIEFDADSAFDTDLQMSTKILGIDITTTFDIPNYMKFGWDIDFDGEGYVSIDTDEEEVYSMDFEMRKNTTQYKPKWGIYISATGLIAEDYVISWDFTPPPGQWILQYSGYIEPGCINDIKIGWNGQWYNLLGGGTPTQF